jgi:hypothetical protein
VEDHQNLALKLSSARLLRSRPRAAPRFHMVGLGGALLHVLGLGGALLHVLGLGGALLHVLAEGQD